jgi:hypothetical protein
VILTNRLQSDAEELGPGESGGSIANIGRVTLDDSSVTLNRATEGGGIYTMGGTIISQSGSIISGNVAFDPSVGGGIHRSNLNPNITIEPGSVTGNTPQECRPAGSVPNCVE